VIDPALQLVVRLGGALLLGSAAWHKLRDREAFRAVLADYRLLPGPLVPLAAPLVVAVEVALALALLATPRAALGVAGLLAGYALAVGANLARGRRHIDCGCGAAPQPLSGWLVARNLVLAAAFAICAAPSSGRALGALDALSVAGSVAALGFLWQAIDVALANGGRAWATR
jgi:hypothetical protein